jgi:RimJ/RimL family protein N-acetyltransferase
MAAGGQVEVVWYGGPGRFGAWPFSPLAGARPDGFEMIKEPCLALERDVERLDDLWMSGKEEIKLSAALTARDRTQWRIDWLGKKLERELIWIIRDHYGLAGMLVLDPDPAPLLWMEYIVAAKRWRGEKVIGPALIAKAKSLSKMGLLAAEARNDHSRKLLERLGFEKDLEWPFPTADVFVWRREPV